MKIIMKPAFRIAILIIIALIFTYFNNTYFTNKDSNNTLSGEKTALKRFLNCTHIEVSETLENMIFKFKTGNPDITGNFISTCFLDKKQTGYGGELDFILLLDEKFRIENLLLLENRETPAFISMLEKRGFFNSWNGKTIEEAAGLNIDTITGATVTTSSIINNINRLLSNLTGKKITSDLLRKRKYLEYTKIFLYISTFFLAIYSFYSGKNRARKTLIFLSILTTGILTSKMLSFSFFSARLSENPFSLSIHSDTILNFILIIILFYSIFTSLSQSKNFYCYYFCPFGMLQDLFSKTPVKKFRIPSSALYILRFIRPAFFIIMLFSLFTPYYVYSDYFEPFAAFRFLNAPFSAKLIFLITIVLALFIPRVWCRFFCPTGYIFEFIRKRHGK